jgi:acetyl-CoA carboxylase biotin carboxyl carrier protein
MGEMKIKTEVAGRVSALPLAVGATVKAGDDIAIVEAVKMEIPVSSPASGTIKALLVAVDDVVQEDQALAIVETRPTRPERG